MTRTPKPTRAVEAMLALSVAEMRQAAAELIARDLDAARFFSTALEGAAEARLEQDLRAPQERAP